EELAEEARRWAAGEVPPGSLVDAPDATPRARESVAISIRLPRQMVEILKEFARREGIGYQVLLKRWLDDRIQEERQRRKQQRASIQLDSPKLLFQAAAFNVQQPVELSDEARTDEMGRLVRMLPTRTDKPPL